MMKNSLNYLCTLLLCVNLATWANEGPNASAIGKSAAAEKTIQISTLDAMRFSFTPPLEQIDDGEAIHFVVTNSGTVSKEITWAFSGTGPVVFACNIPGHYQAGMFLMVPIG